MLLASCSAGVPKGQVVAVVNGQEVTTQDLASEQRATPTQAQQDPKTILQRVVARVLLAQAAHARKLDTYPGYPTDVARLHQTFLAEKLLQTVLKPAAKPTPSDVARFMDAHPYAFKQREKFEIDEIIFQMPDSLKSLTGADTIPAVLSRLKNLDIPVQRATRTIDSAQMPPEMSAKLNATTNGQLFFVQDHDRVVGISILGRDSAQPPIDQQQAQAAQLLTEVATRQQVDHQVNALRGQAKIVYQPTYAPDRATFARPKAN